MAWSVPRAPRQDGGLRVKWRSKHSTLFDWPWKLTKSDLPKNLALLLLFSFLIGGNYSLVKIAQETIPPITLTMTRGLLASLFLLYVVGVVMRRDLAPLIERAGSLVLLGALLSFFFVSLAYAEHRISPSLSSLLSCVIPVSAFLVSTLVLRRESFSFFRLSGLFVALFGVAMFVGLEAFRIDELHVLAITVLSAGYVGYAIQIIYAEAKELDPFVAATGTMVYLFFIAAVLAFAIERPLDVQPNRASVIAIFISGIFCTGLAYLVLFALTQRAGAVFASTSGYLFPIFTILVSHYLMGVRFYRMQLVGVVVTLAGAWMVNRKIGKSSGHPTT